MPEKKSEQPKKNQLIEDLINGRKTTKDLKVTEPSKDLIDRLRKKDVPVLASPDAHG